MNKLFRENFFFSLEVSIKNIKEMITKKIARFSSLAQNADDLKFGLNKGIVEINNKIDTSVFL